MSEATFEGGLMNVVSNLYVNGYVLPSIYHHAHQFGFDVVIL